MSKPKWTNGPWEVGEDGTDVFTTHTEPLLIARTNGDEGHEKDTQLAGADARLIAQAPEMAEALDKLAKWDASHDDGTLISEACSMARAILAKIKGGGDE